MLNAAAVRAGCVCGEVKDPPIAVGVYRLAAADVQQLSGCWLLEERRHAHETPGISPRLHLKIISSRVVAHSPNNTSSKLRPRRQECN